MDLGLQQSALLWLVRRKVGASFDSRLVDLLIGCLMDGNGTRILAHSAETGESLWMLDNAHQGGVSALVLSHNRRFLLSGAPSGDLRLWELRTRLVIDNHGCCWWDNLI